MTLTDLQEAEKTMKTDNKGREREEEEKEAKPKKGEEGVRAIFQTYRPVLAAALYIMPSDITLRGGHCLQEVSWRSRIASLQKSDLLGLTQPAGTPRPQTSDRRGTHQRLKTSSLTASCLLKYLTLSYKAAVWFCSSFGGDHRGE